MRKRASHAKLTLTTTQTGSEMMKVARVKRPRLANVVDFSVNAVLYDNVQVGDTSVEPHIRPRAFLIHVTTGAREPGQSRFNGVFT